MKNQPQSPDANKSLAALRGAVYSEEVNLEAYQTLVGAVNELASLNMVEMAKDYIGPKFWKLYLISKLDEVRYTKDKLKVEIQKEDGWHSEASLAITPILGKPHAQVFYCMIYNHRSANVVPKTNSKNPWSFLVDEDKFPIVSEQGIQLAWEMIQHA